MHLEDETPDLAVDLANGGLSAWIKTLRIEPSVATPIRFLYQDYQAMCLNEGFPEADVADFVRWVSLIEGTSIIEGGHGLLRRVVLGVMPGGHKL